MNELLLELKDITRNEDDKTVLHQVDLGIHAGRIIGVIGDNGLGKTTLLHLMANIIKPDSGEIIRRDTCISYVPTIDEFSCWMRVKDALFFFETYYKNFDLMKANQLIADAGIYSQDKIIKLSKGQQERFFLILSICQNAQLYIMDEPFSGLDPYFKKDIRQFLLQNIPEDATVVMATHLLRELEQLFDEVIFVTPTGLWQMMADEIRVEHQQSIEEYYLEVIQHGA